MAVSATGSVSPRAINVQAQCVVELDHLLANPDTINFEKVNRLCDVMTIEQAGIILRNVVLKEDQKSVVLIVKTHAGLAHSGYLGEAFVLAASQGLVAILSFFLTWNEGNGIISQDLEAALLEAVPKNHLNVVIQLFISGRNSEISQATIKSAHSLATRGSEMAEYLERHIEKEQPDIENKKSGCDVL